MCGVFVISWVVLRVTDPLTAMILGFTFDVTIPLQHYSESIMVCRANRSESESKGPTQGTLGGVLAYLDLWDGTGGFVFCHDPPRLVYPGSVSKDDADDGDLARKAGRWEFCKLGVDQADA